MKGRRTVITGLGIVCPLGSDIESAWQAILSGESGICTVPELENTDISVRIAGLVKGFNADDYLSPKEQRRCDEFIHYGIAAGIGNCLTTSSDTVMYEFIASSLLFGR